MGYYIVLLCPFSTYINGVRPNVAMSVPLKLQLRGRRNSTSRLRRFYPESQLITTYACQSLTFRVKLCKVTLSFGESTNMHVQYRSFKSLIP